jgi:hypothetical protein
MIKVNVDAPTIGRIENEPDFDSSYWVKRAQAVPDPVTFVKKGSSRTKACS